MIRGRIVLAAALLGLVYAPAVSIAVEGYSTSYCYQQQREYIGRCKEKDQTCSNGASTVYASCMRMIENVNECSVCSQTCVSMFEGWDQRRQCISACADGIPNCPKP